MIFDISQELTKCNVYPNDPSPVINKIYDMDKGDLYNLSNISMCAHNGTHLDAPAHFIKNGKTIDKLCLESFIGKAYVVEHQGIVTKENAKKIIEIARKKDIEASKRILIKGNAVVSLDAAKIFASSNLFLLGNESQTVGSEDSLMAVHIELLGSNIVLLEGICLAEVPEGIYLLNAAPLNLSGSDGSPCRAILIALDE